MPRIKKVNMWRTGSRLPSGYQEVEYVQSTGTQKMNIGTQFKSSYKVIIDFQMTVVGGDYIPLGIKASSGYRFGLDVNEGYFRFINGGTYWTKAIPEDTNRHTAIINGDTATIDGNSYSITNAGVSYGDGVGLFYYNDKSSQAGYFYSSCKVYKLDIYDENGIHIHDIIPCYRTSDNVIGMYDLIYDIFYTNSGTGTFTKGADVSYMKEYQVRPYKWYPGSNTIAYLPLNSTNTKNDTYGGNTTTQLGTVRYGTYGGVDCADFTTGGCIYSDMLNGVSTYTVLIWANNINGNSASGGYGGNVVCRSKPSVSYQPGIYYGNSSSSNGYFAFYANNSSGDIYFNTNTKNHWFLLAMCISSSTKKAYLFGDGSYKELDISNSTTNSQYVMIGGTIRDDLTERTDRRFYGYLSNLIVENKVRTAKEIQDYYNSTKSKYGIS